MQNLHYGPISRKLPYRIFLIYHFGCPKARVPNNVPSLTFWLYFFFKSRLKNHRDWSTKKYQKGKEVLIPRYYESKHVNNTWSDQMTLLTRIPLIQENPIFLLIAKIVDPKILCHDSPKVLWFVSPLMPDRKIPLCIFQENRGQQLVVASLGSEVYTFRMPSSISN